MWLSLIVKLRELLLGVQSKVLTHLLKVLTHPRSNKSGGRRKSESEGRSALTVHSYTISTAVPWYMWCNVDMHRTALSIMMLRVVKVSTSAKSTRGWALDLKSIYVLRKWYQF